jgi:hypothetical protein
MKAEMTTKELPMVYNVGGSDGVNMALAVVALSGYDQEFLLERQATIFR